MPVLYWFCNITVNFSHMNMTNMNLYHTVDVQSEFIEISGSSTLHFINTHINRKLPRVQQLDFWNG